MDTEKKEMLEKEIMNSRRLKPTAKEKEIVRERIKKAFEGMGMSSGQTKLTSSKNQEMKSTIKKTKTPRENGLLNNPNITMDERKKTVREKIRKEFEGAPDLIKMLETATKEKARNETKKILDQQEKRQKQKIFLEMISGMKLSEGTISNRVEMSDKGIYENFKNELEKE
ncbi:MAG: hypothetical protein Q4D53_08620, partial [Leptotrichiaceae bacterium]|nr:hypothetical protein [Leptotrichiaceae bacterium]